VKRRHVARLLLAAVLGVSGTSACVVVGTEAPGTGRPAPAGSPPDDAGTEPARRMERVIFDRVNAERAERGRAPVAWDDTLAALARNWSREMAESGQLEHSDLREVQQRDEVSGYVSLGENVFSATGPVPAGTIHAGWMRSPGHRANVLEPGWDRLGVGVVCAEDGSVWATQEFGRTRGAERPPLARETPPEQPIVHPEDEGPSCSR
jgi:uncharacterized protein YkwD